VSADRKYRVLVVDDEAAVLLTYQLILERQGYEVSACGTSVQAIAAVQNGLMWSCAIILWKSSIRVLK
jgi:CheY-like chemotaxis protein